MTKHKSRLTKQKQANPLFLRLRHYFFNLLKFVVQSISGYTLALNKTFLIFVCAMPILLLLKNPESAEARLGVIVTITTIVLGLFSNVRKFVLGKVFGNLWITLILLILLTAEVYAAYQIFQPSVNYITQGGEFTVIVAKFDQSGGVEYEPDLDMLEVLVTAAEEVDNIQLIHYGAVIPDAQQADQLVEKFNAVLLVYGRVAPGGVTVQYAMSRDIKLGLKEYFRISKTDVPDFETFIYKGMDINFVFRFTVGLLHYYKKEFSEAVDWFTRAENLLDVSIIAKSGDNVLYNYRALANQSLGNRSEALKDYDYLINTYPNDPAPYNNRGVFHISTNNLQAAIKDFQQAISVSLYYSKAYYNLGIVYQQLNDPTTSLGYFTEAINTDPNNFDAYLGRARSYVNLKQYDAALTDLQHSLNGSSCSECAKDMQIYITLAEANYHIGNYDQAIFDLTYVIENSRDRLILYPDGKKYITYPLIGIAKVLRGRIYEELGKSNAALTDYKGYFEAFSDLDTNDAPIKLSLGGFDNEDIKRRIKELEILLTSIPPK